MTIGVSSHPVTMPVSLSPRKSKKTSGQSDQLGRLLLPEGRQHEPIVFPAITVGRYQRISKEV
jgi:hypothetical protein